MNVQLSDTGLGKYDSMVCVSRSGWNSFLAQDHRWLTFAWLTPTVYLQPLGFIVSQICVAQSMHKIS